jgi:nucleoside-diphosphate-sugar epimerase
VNTERPTIAILGASSLVGEVLISQLEKSHRILAFSRQARTSSTPSITWHTTDELVNWQQAIDHWICVAPVWVLPDYFNVLKRCEAKRVIVLSSTSRFTKVHSTDEQEKRIVERLVEGETSLQNWGNSNNIGWTILRPTLIYGYGKDKNISEIARFIQRFGFFPVFGKARGLRQPIHADDVAQACIRALQTDETSHKAYNISGGETLTYRDMVKRIFHSLNKRPILIAIPLPVFKFMISVLRYIPRYKKWSVSMAERMNQDLVFDHTEAQQTFDFSAKDFLPPNNHL